MKTLREAATEFLAHRRIAVAGVSGNSAATANYIFRRMRELKFEVFPVNPNADQVEGERCYHSLAEIPGGVEGVLIVTHPRVAASVVQECAALHIPRVWMHRSVDAGSVSAEAIDACERAGIAYLAGGCPMMFMDPVDFGHKCMRAIFRWTGKLPDGSTYEVPMTTTH